MHSKVFEMVRKPFMTFSDVWFSQADHLLKIKY